jgi:glycosyltransferase involved in cell wall biosynthesis
LLNTRLAVRVLFIAYHFPPIGGAGSQRSLKFVRYLGDFGVEPVVVAGPPPTGTNRWEPADADLAAEIPAGTPIYRPDDGSPEPARLDPLRRRLDLVSARDRWWQHQIMALGRRANDATVLDAIFVTLSPYEGLDAAVRLGRELGLPVVADLRDPWALDEVRLYPSAVHRRLDLARMTRLLTQCALVIANTREAGAALAAQVESISDRIRVITNGFDPADFAGLEPAEPSDLVRIVHTGYLHSGLGLAQRKTPWLKRALGGDLTEVDLLARSHFYLLSAIAGLRETDAELAARVRLVLAGVFSDQDVRLVEESSIADQVEMVGYVTHHAAIQRMLSADILFLPMHDLPGGVRSRIVPGKTYEYLASNRPILAAVPEGDARDLVAAHGAMVVAPSDVSGMTRAIAELAERPRSAATTGLRPGLEDFERRTLAGLLAVDLTVLKGT